MEEASYSRVPANISFCQFCHKTLTLLYHRRFQMKKAQFYICWHCQRVFEAGKGEVKNEERF